MQNDPIPLEDKRLIVDRAIEANMSEDQLTRFIAHGYLPFPWQMKFHAQCRLSDQKNQAVDIGVGGARGPGKSFAVFAQIALDDCQRFSGLKALFLRQTGKSAQESFEDLISKVVRGKVKYIYNSSRGVLSFPNESRILLGGFETERDIDKYVGIEYDLIGVEELNQLTEDKIERLKGSLRTAKQGWRPRMYTSFNPGGIGHEFVKKTYVIPFREQNQTKTAFFPANYLDNPYLNEEYITYLKSLTGDLGKAWRDGEWDIFAGQFFPEFTTRTHVIRPFEPKPEIKKYGGIDWGYNAPFAFEANFIKKEKTQGGIAFNRLITYKEITGKEKSPEVWGKIIAETVNLDEFEAIYCDPSMFNKKDDGSISLADQMRPSLGDNGYKLKPANNKREAGWALMHNWLSLAPDGLPYWLITENCRKLIDTLPKAVYDEHNIEDIDCFVAGTQIKTIGGYKNIEDINKTDLIYTPIGYRRSYKIGKPIKTKTIKIYLSNKKTLQGTLDHKVYVFGKGLIELSKLQKHDILIGWNNQNINQLFIKVWSIEDIWEEGIINLMGHILQKGTKHSISKFGLIILGLFLKINTYIIRIIILIIMTPAILRLFLQKNMQNFTTMSDIKMGNYQKGLKNGDNLKKERLYCIRTYLKCLKELLQGNYRAIIVEDILRQNIKHKNIVQQNVGLKIDKVKNASFVEKEKRGITRHVHIVAVGNSEDAIVYKLNIKQAHLYYANGILTTNTECEDHQLDAERYIQMYLKWIDANVGQYALKIEEEKHTIKTVQTIAINKFK